MGGGTYSLASRSVRAESAGYFTKSVHETFSERSINNAMDPHGLSIRESRDSNEHPDSLAIVIALDLTGSMGSVPAHMVKDGLPTMVSKIIQRGIAHPQILFTGVGDHECDKAPLQVGQFESSDELLDHWLTKIYLEGNGGGNEGESYLLAWYLAAKHTAIDCLEKRGKKGYLFTIGDEPTLKRLPAHSLKNIIGNGQFSDTTHLELLDQARQMYHVYHVHLKETGAGSRMSTVDGWRQIMGDNLIIVDRHGDIPNVIAEKIVENEKIEKPTFQPQTIKEEKINDGKEEIML